MAKYLVMLVWSPIVGRHRAYRVAEWDPLARRWRARPEWADEVALADDIYLAAQRQAASAN
jgi:hypothetical protein